MNFWSQYLKLKINSTFNTEKDIILNPWTPNRDIPKQNKSKNPSLLKSSSRTTSSKESTLFLKRFSETKPASKWSSLNLPRSLSSSKLWTNLRESTSARILHVSTVDKVKSKLKKSKRTLWRMINVSMAQKNTKHGWIGATKTKRIPLFQKLKHKSRNKRKNEIATITSQS